MYPKYLYHAELAVDGRLIRSSADEPSGDGWVDSPAKFDTAQAPAAIAPPPNQPSVAAAPAEHVDVPLTDDEDDIDTHPSAAAPVAEPDAVPPPAAAPTVPEPPAATPKAPKPAKAKKLKT